MVFIIPGIVGYVLSEKNAFDRRNEAGVEEYLNYWSALLIGKGMVFIGALSRVSLFIGMLALVVSIIAYANTP